MARSLLLGLIAAVLVPAAWLLSRADEPSRRFALLVGVKSYEGTGLGNLKYPEDDVHALAAVLKSAGFKVVVMTQKEARDRDNDDFSPTADNIRLNLKNLLEDRRANDTVVVFFSGHGGQLKKNQEMHFFPRKANLDDPKTLISLTEVYDLLKRKAEAAQKGYKVLLVDACRNDPVDGKAAGDGRMESVTQPLQEKLPGGVAALFSCSEGQKSFESDQRRHGFFTYFLIEGLQGKAANPKTGIIDLLGLANYVKNELPFAVQEEKGPRARQTPNLLGDLRDAPMLSRIKVDKVPTPRPRPAPAKTKLNKEVDNNLGMRFMLVPKGTFWMGGANGKPGDKQVEIHEDFYLSATPVTQGQWQAIMGKNPSWFSRMGGGAESVKGIADADLEQFPVENVSWDEVQEFLTQLNGKLETREWKYRLPKEAEWEYACRGAANSKEDCAFSFYFAKPTNNLSSEDANFDGNHPAGSAAKGHFLNRPSKLASYAPNRLGLYDMHGNVWQWCEDRWEEGSSYHVRRGGCWHAPGPRCTAAQRAKTSQAVRLNVIGFRLARVPAGRKGK